MEILFLHQNSYKLMFLLTSMFEWNVSYVKTHWTGDLSARLWIGSRLKSKTVCILLYENLSSILPSNLICFTKVYFFSIFHVWLFEYYLVIIKSPKTILLLHHPFYTFVKSKSLSIYQRKLVNFVYRLVTSFLVWWKFYFPIKIHCLDPF